MPGLKDRDAFGPIWTQLSPCVMIFLRGALRELPFVPLRRELLPLQARDRLPSRLDAFHEAPAGCSAGGSRPVRVSTATSITGGYLPPFYPIGVKDGEFDGDQQPKPWPVL